MTVISASFLDKFHMLVPQNGFHISPQLHVHLCKLTHLHIHKNSLKAAKICKIVNLFLFTAHVKTLERTFFGLNDQHPF